MQIYIKNKPDFDECYDYETQKSVHRALCTEVMRMLANKEKVKTVNIGDDTFTYSHTFIDVLFFEFKGGD